MISFRSWSKINQLALYNPRQTVSGMEVIHRYNGAYPFFLEHEGEQTYLEILKTNLSQQEIADEREKLKILNEIDQTNLVKLVKIYRENSNVHLLYEYFPVSLEKYVEERSQSAKDNHKNEIKQLHQQFVSAIDRIVDSFVEGQIKTDISIHNMAVSSIEEGCLKLFVDPAAQFHRIYIQNFVQHLNRHFNCRDRNGCKVRLVDFYSAQKKRLIMEFEEWLEKYFGKDSFINQPNHPNFVINGTKLVFINQHNAKSEVQNQNRYINEGAGTDGRNVLRNSPGKMDRIDDMKRDLMQKNMKKIEEIKNVLNRIQSKTPTFNQQTDHRLTPHKQHETQHQELHHHEKRQNPAVSHDNPHLARPSNQRLMHPQQVQSIIFSSEDNSIDKPQNPCEPVDEKRSRYLQYIKQGNTTNKVKRVPTLKEEQKEKFREEAVKPDKPNHNDTKIIPNNSTNKLDSLQKEGVTKVEVKKQDKHNKYKMRITTSHEIEIEGKGEPQIEQIEKDIMEGIKSGRIPLSEFSDQPRGFKIQATSIQQVGQPEKEDRANTSTESPKQNVKLSDIGSKRQYQTNPNGNNYEYLSSSLNEHKGNGIKIENDYSPQDFSEKIREAKNKAEQVLKQYAKKKQ